MKKLLCIVCLVLFTSLLQAQEAEMAQAPWTLLDQFDQAYTLNDQLKILLVARSMDGAKWVNQALEGKPKGYLESRNAVFVADISRMPRIISTLFALPAMRDYSYRVLLDRQPRVTPRYPGDAGKVLWIEMDQGKVKSQREFSDSVALDRALQQVAE